MKVGDKVKISIPRNEKDWKYNGMDGKIVAIEHDRDMPVKVELKNDVIGDIILWFKINEVEKI